MERIIKDIIDADRAARERVSQVKSEAGRLSEILQEQRVKITKQYEQTSIRKKAAYEEKLKAQLQQHREQSDQAYEEAAQALDEQFQKEKSRWVNEIFQHCLKK